MEPLTKNIELDNNFCINDIYCDDVIHSLLANGYVLNITPYKYIDDKDAYAEMCIKALDARTGGKILYVDHDDNLIEALDEEFFKKFCEEIEIGDVVEGTSNEDLDK